jgi:hypothetical protein
MILRNILFFLIVCGVAGVCIVLGSVLGHKLGQVGLFSGAVIGGIAGVAVAVWLTVRLGLLDRANVGLTLLGGVAGFIVAVVIAVNNLHGPIIPVASVAFIGLGALIGKMVGYKRAA